MSETAQTIFSNVKAVSVGVPDDVIAHTLIHLVFADPCRSLSYAGVARLCASRRAFGASIRARTEMGAVWSLAFFTRYYKGADAQEAPRQASYVMISPLISTAALVLTVCR